MSGTPEKILEHLLEMMRLDSQFTESGSARRPGPDLPLTAWRSCFSSLLSSLAQCFSPLSSFCCSVLTRLFSSIINRPSQRWSHYSHLSGYIWFLLARRSDGHRALCFVSAPPLSSQVFHTSFSLCFNGRFGLRRLFAHSPCLHPKQSTVSSPNGPISFQLYILSLLTSRQKNRSLSSSFAFIFNPWCTYHAQASQGCEQERMDYTLNNKRRVIRLVMQWAAVHGDHLQDEEDSVAFLQVRQDNTHQLHQFGPYFPFWC